MPPLLSACLRNVNVFLKKELITFRPLPIKFHSLFLIGLFSVLVLASCDKGTETTKQMPLQTIGEDVVFRHYAWNRGYLEKHDTLHWYHGAPLFMYLQRSGTENAISVLVPNSAGLQPIYDVMVGLRDANGNTCSEEQKMKFYRIKDSGEKVMYGSIKDSVIHTPLYDSTFGKVVFLSDVMSYPLPGITWYTVMTICPGAKPFKITLRIPDEENASFDPFRFL